MNQIIPFIGFGQYINAKDMETRIKLSYFQNDYLGTDSNTAAAMLISGTWSLSAIMTTNPDANIGFSAFPLNDPGEPITIPTNANEGICVVESAFVSDVSETMQNSVVHPDW